MKWEVLLSAFDRGNSIAEAITELAAEVVDFFEAIL